MNYYIYLFIANQPLINRYYLLLFSQIEAKNVVSLNKFKVVQNLFTYYDNGRRQQNNKTWSKNFVKKESELNSHVENVCFNIFHQFTCKFWISVLYEIRIHNYVHSIFLAQQRKEENQDKQKSNRKSVNI